MKGELPEVDSRAHVDLHGVHIFIVELTGWGVSVVVTKDGLDVVNYP